MAEFKISKGQRVRIRKYNSSAPSILGSDLGKDSFDGINDSSFMLASEYTFVVGSSFSQLMDYSPSTVQVMVQQATQFIEGNGFIGKTLKSVGEIAGGYYDWMGIKVWSSTDPISTSVTFDILPSETQPNPLIPLKALMKLVVPKVGEPKLDKLFGNKMKPLIFPGPNVFKEMGFGENKDYPDAQDMITLCIGNLLFSQVVIEKVEPTIPTEFTTDGYPAWIRVQVYFSTCKIATDQMIEEVLGGATEILPAVEGARESTQGRTGR